MERIHWILLALFSAVLGWSAYGNADYFTWALEVAPGGLGVAVLALTFKRFQFSRLAYVVILLHCAVLFVGAKYTYAKVPLFDWLADSFDWPRNNYDKVGHFMQGFGPAVIAREVMIRLHAVNGGKWLNCFVLSFCLAVSAAYELVEWFVAEAIGDDAEAFLGTQGYVWDTQSDMLFALIGALCMLLFFSRVHDRSIEHSRESGYNKLPSSSAW